MGRPSKKQPEEPAILQPESVEPAIVKATYIPRLTGQPEGKTGNVWLLNKRTGRTVWMNATQAAQLVKRTPSQFEITNG